MPVRAPDFGNAIGLTGARLGKGKKHAPLRQSQKTYVLADFGLMPRPGHGNCASLFRSIWRLPRHIADMGVSPTCGGVRGEVYHLPVLHDRAIDRWRSFSGDGKNRMGSFFLSPSITESTSAAFAFPCLMSQHPTTVPVRPLPPEAVDVDRFPPDRGRRHLVEDHLHLRHGRNTGVRDRHPEAFHWEAFPFGEEAKVFLVTFGDFGENAISYSVSPPQFFADIMRPPGF